MHCPLFTDSERAAMAVVAAVGAPRATPTTPRALADWLCARLPALRSRRREALYCAHRLIDTGIVAEAARPSAERRRDVRRAQVVVFVLRTLAGRAARLRALLVIWHRACYSPSFRATARALATAAKTHRATAARLLAALQKTWIFGAPRRRHRVARRLGFLRRFWRLRRRGRDIDRRHLPRRCRPLAATAAPPTPNLTRAPPRRRRRQRDGEPPFCPRARAAAIAALSRPRDAVLRARRPFSPPKSPAACLSIT